MKNDVLCYEVELVAEDRTTKAREMVTRREYAYSMMDAMTQAAVALLYERPNTDVKVAKIGPPRETIEAASATDAAVVNAVNDAMRRVLGVTTNE